MMYRKYYAHTPGKQNCPIKMNCILGLIIINVLAFILVPKVLWLQLMLSSYGIQHLKLWQLFSYMFLHGSFLHLFVNMWGLFLFGRHVLARLGTERFLILYFLSGLSGAGLWLCFNWGSRIPVIGASGAVFGVMLAAAMFMPNMRIMLLFPPIPMTLKTFVLAYAVIEILSELSHSQSGVAHLAHLGGFLGAYVYIRMLSGERIWDIVTSPLRGFSAMYKTRQSGNQNHIFPPKRSEVNRKTFEEIMAEIEEIEREQKRKPYDHDNDL